LLVGNGANRTLLNRAGQSARDVASTHALRTLLDHADNPLVESPEASDAER